ncbi:hypothetical protein [Streptomyces sp. NPDC050264]|uniref:hypothetical protein n=1 Tax=Streptomyces sp. NPDC050264 TaxID=3155038 RepID=UPI00344911E9
MSLQMVRFRTDSGTAAEVRSQRARVFAALHAASPRGVVHTAYSSESGPDFILALELEEAAENPLVGLPQAAQLRDLISRAVGAPVRPEPFVVVGSYHS